MTELVTGKDAQDIRGVCFIKTRFQNLSFFSKFKNVVLLKQRDISVGKEKNC